MVEKGDRMRFRGYKEEFVGVITSTHFCEAPDPKYSHWRATMRCDPGQKSTIVEGNIAFFEPTKEMTMQKFLKEYPHVGKCFAMVV